MPLFCRSQRQVGSVVIPLLDEPAIHPKDQASDPESRPIDKDRSTHHNITESLPLPSPSRTTDIPISNEAREATTLKFCLSATTTSTTRWSNNRSPRLQGAFPEATACPLQSQSLLWTNHPLRTLAAQVTQDVRAMKSLRPSLRNME